MRARQSIINIAAALAIGMALLQPPSGAAAEEKKTTQGSTPVPDCGHRCHIEVESFQW
jgi:anaerobic selenocysteine-containing dehydrogenase